MNKLHFILIVLLGTFNIQAININTTECDSTLFFCHPKHSIAFCKIGGKIITRKEGFDLLISYKPSAYEFKWGQRICRRGFAFIGGSLLAFAIPSIICVPISLGCLTVGMIMLGHSNKHLRKSIELYNENKCRNKVT